MKKNTAYTGVNAAYLEELANDDLFQAHEFAKHSAIEAFKAPPVVDNQELVYQQNGSKNAQLNPLAEQEFNLPEHAAYRNKYCGKIAFDYMHITCPKKLAWWQNSIEEKQTWQPSSEQAKNAYTQLQQAEQMEHILSRKFVGQTRFSLEGCDALIPLIELILQESVIKYDLKEVVIGMPHRGRLNVMQNIMGMSFASLCDLYTGVRECLASSSDVTYHMGYSSDREFSGNKLHLSLAFNPSHLEFIVPVVMGSVKARQDSGRFEQPLQVLPIVMHGDAAVAGQGVVAEWFNMMHTKANNIHGAIHIVVNNQIGFTTDSAVGRSGYHPTDAHKYADVPVIHVNADDIDAVLYAAKVAAAYRAKFASSVFINLIGYRRYGHNEGDDPKFTQPKMYQAIKQHPSVLKIYEKKLLDSGLLSADDADNISKDIAKKLSQGAATIMTESIKQDKTWFKYSGIFDQELVTTKVTKTKIKSYTDIVTQVPDNFSLHKQVAKLLSEYKNAASGDAKIRWGFAEQLAYASLLDEGFGVRLVGQDVERGTFSHRHAVWTDQNDYSKHCPLTVLASNNKRSEFFNSTLSEQAVVGFEYGYSLAEPETLTIWEAQYGDFCNGAQVIIDQFISSSWQKWQRMSGLVMLLPHGYEGAGPEHSSARLERFLQLAAEQNMRICVPSNAAQIFHLLRLQMHQKARVPLIVMSPKSLLRLPEAMSDITQLTNSGFKTIIPDELDQKFVTRIILCSGKVYYDLIKYRAERNDVAIVRIEQLYPFDTELCQQVIACYENLQEVVWCQEEPKNQGAWYNIRHHIEAVIPNSVKLACVSRVKSASPAAGYKQLHQQRQELVVKNSFEEI